MKHVLLHSTVIIGLLLVTAYAHGLRIASLEEMPSSQRPVSVFIMATK
jgi:hypothetical protein